MLNFKILDGMVGAATGLMSPETWPVAEWRERLEDAAAKSRDVAQKAVGLSVGLAMVGPVVTLVCFAVVCETIARKKLPDLGEL